MEMAGRLRAEKLAQQEGWTQTKDKCAPSGYCAVNSRKITDTIVAIYPPV